MGSPYGGRRVVGSCHDRESRLRSRWPSCRRSGPASAPHPDRSEAAAAARKPAPQCTQTEPVRRHLARSARRARGAAGGGRRGYGRPATRAGGGHRGPAARAPSGPARRRQARRSSPPGRSASPSGSDRDPSPARRGRRRPRRPARRARPRPMRAMSRRASAISAGSSASKTELALPRHDPTEVGRQVHTELEIQRPGEVPGGERPSRAQVDDPLRPRWRVEGLGSSSGAGSKIGAAWPCRFNGAMWR